MGDRWLERALEAEEQLESCRERVRDLEARIKSALNAEPTAASRALSWIGRAQNAEQLLIELVRRDLALPPPLRTRIEAQLHTVEILRRDQEALGEKPPSEEWWESWKDPDAPRSFLRTSKERSE